MTLQMPLLFFIGSLVIKRNPAKIHRNAIDIDLFGWVCVSTTLSVWMIPRIMDVSVENWPVDAVKFCLLLLSGAWTTMLVRYGSGPLAIFFCTNISGMLAIAGMLYTNSDIRLCNAYLFNDQAYTGNGLIVIAIISVIATVFFLGKRGLDSVLGSNDK